MLSKSQEARLKDVETVELEPGSRGYVSVKGVPDLCSGVRAEYQGRAKGAGGIVHHIFKAARGGWLLSATDIEIAIRTTVFTKKPVELTAR